LTLESNDNGPVSFCGRCGKNYNLDLRKCPDCNATLVVWRPKSEPLPRTRRWWTIVNWPLLGFASKPLIDNNPSPPADDQSADVKP
jgi:hypothetical protein